MEQQTVQWKGREGPDGGQPVRHHGGGAATVVARVAALVLVAGALAACSGGSDDDTVRMTDAPDDAASKQSAAETSSDTQQALNAPIGVDAAQLLSPVSQAPVGQQTVRQAQRPAGQDLNPPRHP
ncbi:hypothetical protein [Cupriavidus sp. AU9028]|uniref:hypothetical protein n=1 Tax=Cupriavidus sp. AU9028 TaxID=2871157 RepID=UPI001C9613EB|nr:hypothetical protein [Cupriavidus sp. AU9028]MBY4896829.1 hypothetical protein [Cupriavidus sp. AU9028]